MTTRRFILEQVPGYGRWLIVAAAFVVPVVYHRAALDVFNLPKLMVLWILGLSALALWVVWSAERRSWLPRLRLGYLVAGLVGAGVLATMTSTVGAASIIGRYQRYGGLIPLLLYAAVWLAIVGLFWEKPEALNRVAVAAALASVVVAGYVLIQRAGLDWNKWQTSDQPVTVLPFGTMGNSNFAGGYLATVLPLIAYLVLESAKAKRAVWMAAGGLSLAGLWFTQSRGGLIAAAAGLGAMLLVYRERLPMWMRLGAVAGAFAAVLVAVAVLWHPGMNEAPEPFRKLNIFGTDTLELRRWLWGGAVRIFLDRPLLGTGLDSFYSAYPLHRAAADGAEEGLALSDKPHSVLLEYAAGTGIPGLAAFVALFALAMWWSYRQSRAIEGPTQGLTAAVVGVLAAYLGQALFSIDVPVLASTGWIALGAAAAIADPGVLAARERLAAAARERHEARGKGKRRRKSRSRDGIELRNAHLNRNLAVRWPAHVAAALGLVVALILAGRIYQADMAAFTGRVFRARGSLEESVRHYDRAIRLNPLESAYQVDLARLWETLAQKKDDTRERSAGFQRAADHYQEALEIQPGSIFHMVRVARVYGAWGSTEPARFRDADRWWLRAADRDPTDWEVHNEHALMLEAWGNATDDDGIRLRAASTMTTVTRIRPDRADAWTILGRIYLKLGDSIRARIALGRALQLDPEYQEAKNLVGSQSSQ